MGDAKKIDTAATRKVAEALAAHADGMAQRMRALDETARSAGEAAAALGVPVNAIVKTLIFDFIPDDGGDAIPLAVLISGDRQCATDALAGAIGKAGKIKRPDADRVKSLTGYSIGGVSPAGLPGDMTVLIDDALARAETLWAAAGHPHLVFGCAFDELVAITGGRVCEAISR